MGAELSIRILLGLVLGILPLVIAGGMGYLLLSLPLRRQERARLFLELVENGMRAGRSPAQTVLSAASTGDAVLGARFHLVAAYLETGLPLGEALRRVPRFLPPRVTALLEVGEQVGYPAKVLPACRRLLPDARASAQGALNYVITAGLLVFPAAPAVLGVLTLFVFPKFRVLFHEFGDSSPGLTSWVMDWGESLAQLCGLLSLVLYLIMLAYVAGPRLRAFWPALADRLDWWIPWRRMRMQRDAAGLLGDLLDAGLPEESAVALSAQGTGSGLMQWRAVRTVEQLRNGHPLPVAVRRMDDSGELAWRLENARNSPGGFRPALAGWMASLDARSYQRQQGLTHLLTTSVVLFNGLVVGLVVVGIFQALISVLDAAVLW